MSNTHTQNAIANLMVQRSALTGVISNPYRFYLNHAHTGSLTDNDGEISSREPETVDLETIPQFKQLREEVTRLTNMVAAQHQSIQELWQIIDGLRQNSTGQRVNQTSGYWEETRY